jgi:hypothetical protein
MRVISRRLFTGVVTIITAAGIIIVGTAITDGIVTMDGMGITIAVIGVDPDSLAPLLLNLSHRELLNSRCDDVVANAKSP